MAAEMDPAVQKILREPFPPEHIGVLPKLTCRDCSKAQAKVCDRHTKSQCRVCSNWISGGHTHLNYVGHAAVTDRLLKADPGWSWEPAYRDVNPLVLAAAVTSGDSAVVQLVIANAPPLQDPTGMWIKLTVAGVTRLGYGTDDSPGIDHDKVLIGDAIRNAAMRFGVGLDLWSKEDLRSDEPTPPFDSVVTGGPARRDWAQEAKDCTNLDDLLRIGRECSDAGGFVGTDRTALIRRRRELENPDEAALPLDKLFPTPPSVTRLRLARPSSQSPTPERNAQ